MTKAKLGNYFEDFSVGQTIQHATPITLTEAHAVQFQAFYAPRFAVQASDHFASGIGFDRAPLHNMLVFHSIFGKSVPDISLNAIANLGYADVRWMRNVQPRDTLIARSRIIGLKQNSNGKSGTVYVHTTGMNQHAQDVLSFTRWVMVRKKAATAPALESDIPSLPAEVEPAGIIVPPELKIPAGTFDHRLSGSTNAWEDYAVGEIIAHASSVQMASDHMNATRFLGHNTAAVHFDAAKTGTGHRLIYGGHVMQHVLSMTYNGLENALDIVAINGGSHVAPVIEGDSLQAFSKILAKSQLPNRTDVALLRVQSVGFKTSTDATASDVAYKIPDPAKPGLQKYDPRVVLDLDYWILVPTAKSMHRSIVEPPANHRLNAAFDAPVFRTEPRAERMIHFFPPQNEKMREKAKAMVADGAVDVLLGNFEDGVPKSQKDAARQGFIEFAGNVDMGRVGLWVRTNQIWTGPGVENALFLADVRDVVASVGRKLDVMMVPKIETAADIRHVHKMLTRLEAEFGLTRPIRIHAILETAKGIVNVNDIAKASPRMHGMSFGPADYAADMGLKTTVVGGTVVGYETIGPREAGLSDDKRQRTQQDVWHYHIAAMVAACRASDIKPMFGPFGAIGDPIACEVQFRNAYLMGMEGAWSLHPSQIDIAKAVFSPSSGEVAKARKIIAALPEDGSGAALDENGNFIDDAVIKQARVILTVAGQVAARDPNLAAAYGL